MRWQVGDGAIYTEERCEEFLALERSSCEDGEGEVPEGKRRSLYQGRLHVLPHGSPNGPCIDTKLTLRVSLMFAPFMSS